MAPKQLKHRKNVQGQSSDLQNNGRHTQRVLLPHNSRVTGSLLSSGYCVEIHVITNCLCGFVLGSLVPSHL